MKNAKPKIGLCKPCKNTKGLGIITLGKARPAPKMVEMDVTYDEKAEKDLYKTGMKALKHDKEAVIQYVIVKALTGYAKCKK
jgi:hypothetical protein